MKATDCTTGLPAREVDRRTEVPILKEEAMSNQTTFIERLSIIEEWRGSGYIEIVTERKEEKMLRSREKLFFFFPSDRNGTAGTWAVQ